MPLFARHRDGRAALGDRVHRRADNGHLEVEPAAEPRFDLHVLRQDLAVGGHEEDVVERQALAELVVEHVDLYSAHPRTPVEHHEGTEGGATLPAHGLEPGRRLALRSGRRLEPGDDPGGAQAPSGCPRGRRRATRRGGTRAQGATRTESPPGEEAAAVAASRQSNRSADRSRERADGRPTERASGPTLRRRGRLVMSIQSFTSNDSTRGDGVEVPANEARSVSTPAAARRHAAYRRRRSATAMAAKAVAAKARRNGERATRARSAQSVAARRALGTMKSACWYT